MIIDDKYRLDSNPLKTLVTELLDFQEYPILNLEKDLIGNLFLSYLCCIASEHEERLLIQISEDRLNSFFGKNVDLKTIFNEPELGHIYFCLYNIETGKPIDTFLIPQNVFIGINPIPSDYFIERTYKFHPPILDSENLLNYAIRKNKLVFDLYLQSKNLIYEIKPYAFYKIVNPIVEIIKSFLEIDQRNIDEFLAFSNIRQKSLGISIEVNYSGDFFLERESTELNKLIKLLSSNTKEDLIQIISQAKNNKFLKEYSKVIKTIVDNDASLFTAYANPVKKEVLDTRIDKDQAVVIKAIIDESFDIVEDVETIEGIFLEVDIDKKEPSFKILSIDDDQIMKGKFENSLLEKLKSDKINLGKDNYVFTIKTIYHPQTTVKQEEINRYLVDYVIVNK